MLNELIIVAAFVGQTKLDFYPLLTNLAMHIKLQRITLVLLIVDMLEFSYEPSLQAFPVNVS